MSNPVIKKLISEIEDFLRLTGEKETSFCRAAVNDGSFLADLREGREPRWPTIEGVRKYINDGTRKWLAENSPEKADAA